MIRWVVVAGLLGVGACTFAPVPISATNGAASPEAAGDDPADTPNSLPVNPNAATTTGVVGVTHLPPQY